MKVHDYMDCAQEVERVQCTWRRGNMLTILIVILLLLSLGSLPTWPHSRSWGYYPSSGLGLVVVILVVLLLLGRI